MEDFTENTGINVISYLIAFLILTIKLINKKGIYIVKSLKAELRETLKLFPAETYLSFRPNTTNGLE